MNVTCDALDLNIQLPLSRTCSNLVNLNPPSWPDITSPPHRMGGGQAGSSYPSGMISYFVCRPDGHNRLRFTQPTKSTTPGNGFISNDFVPVIVSEARQLELLHQERYGSQGV